MTRAPLTSYQRRLIGFLSVATLFEGWDFFALAQILPNLRAEFGLSPGEAGLLVAVVNVGTILAAFLLRKADVWGRRRVLTITIVGYTLASLVTALAPNVWLFALAQLLARVFLIGEWGIAMVYAAEEYPADRRGLVIGVIQACSSLGSILCAAAVPALLQTPWGWRSIYVVGAVPLVIVAYARRNLQETRRFSAHGAGAPDALPLTGILRTPYLKRVLQLAAIWSLTYLCTQSGVTFWKEFAIAERGMTDAQVAGSLTIAALASMPALFFAGRLLDLVGRRLGAVITFTITSVGVFLAYTLESRVGLTFALVLGIFGSSAVLPVLNAYTAELFPTPLRSGAFAWANNLLGRIGYVGSPLVVGLVASTHGWGFAVSLTAIAPLLALALIWLLLPETRGRELEETSAL
jgi:putative MFS transporter